jgi:quaternary ammonium compound-resistance protein SugE
MAWVGLFEAGWAIGLKYTEGFSRLWPTIWTRWP